MSMIISLLRSQSGATAIEYGLIASLLAIVLIVALRAIGVELPVTFGFISTAIDNSVPD
jgi:pilus assembly protein Flp/PilA